MKTLNPRAHFIIQTQNVISAAEGAMFSAVRSIVRQLPVHDPVAFVVNRTEPTVRQIFRESGLKVGGARPEDPHIYNPLFYPRVLAGGSLALGESYMDGWWTCERIDLLIQRLLASNADQKISAWRSIPAQLSAYMSNLIQTEQTAFDIGETHYDIGNDLYERMLGEEMAYSCAIFDEPQATLEEAQRAKFERICQKLELTSGDRVLDIGCGWGSFARYAAENFDVRVTGITVSRRQAAYATKLCKWLPVDIQLKDYRALRGKYKHAVSIGMFEHVGPSNYRQFMEIVHESLAANGKFLLQTIGGNASYKTIDPWIHRYIFPRAVLPSVKQIGDATEQLFVMESWENLGLHYAETLMRWYRRFDDRWEEIRDIYHERFYRMWRYYLQSCAGVFRARHNHAWQILFSKGSPRTRETLSPAPTNIAESNVSNRPDQSAA